MRWKLYHEVNKNGLMKFEVVVVLWSVGRFGWDGGGLGGTVVGWKSLVGWWWVGRVGWDGGEMAVLDA